MPACEFFLEKSRLPLKNLEFNLKRFQHLTSEEIKNIQMQTLFMIELICCKFDTIFNFSLQHLWEAWNNLSVPVRSRNTIVRGTEIVRSHKFRVLCAAKQDWE